MDPGHFLWCSCPRVRIVPIVHEGSRHVHLRYMRFRLECYRRLRKTLGEVDCVVEILEVALRELRHQVDESGTSGVHLRQRAAFHGIRVNLPAFPNIEQQAARSYITLVFAELDGFLNELGKVHRRFFTSDWTPLVGESALATARRVVFPADHQDARIEATFELCDYYRLVRNETVADLGANRFVETP